MTPRPRPVTIQFLAVSATPGKTFARLMPAPQHIRLIVKPVKLSLNISLPRLDFHNMYNVHHGVSVKNQILSPDTSLVFGKFSPGTMTEANACHNKVSIAAMATLLVSAPGSFMEEID